ncbi:DinB family protein [Ruegeria arenilitoris]|uniref:DinB family protein n=1 Tax=Ruegeria arenilitoris TaxID=1173585 RepID=UPI0014814C64|nr:DinB family protein [Ruegeria arenilitoris]
MKNYFFPQAYNNAWANHRILEACAQLPPEELAKHRTGFFPSIIETLNHIYTVDLFYVTALEGRPMGLDAFDPETPYPDLPELSAHQRAIDQRFVDVCRDEKVLDETARVRIPRGDVVQVERYDRTILHLLQHQIHHRGQVHSMLSGTMIAPPQLDEFFMEWEADRSLRAEDFASLNLTEEEVWQGL